MEKELKQVQAIFPEAKIKKIPYGLPNAITGKQSYVDVIDFKPKKLYPYLLEFLFRIEKSLYDKDYKLNILINCIIHKPTKDFNKILKVLKSIKDCDDE